MWGRSFLLAGILATGATPGRRGRERVTANSVREAGIDAPACARMSACHRLADVRSGCGLRRIALLPLIRELAALGAANVSMVAPSAPRDARSKTPPGPEGSNGIDRRGRRGQPAGPSPFLATPGPGSCQPWLAPLAGHGPSLLQRSLQRLQFGSPRRISGLAGPAHGGSCTSTCGAVGSASGTHCPGCATRCPRTASAWPSATLA